MIADTYTKKTKTENYVHSTIQDVVVGRLEKHFVTQDGTFTELTRLNEKGNLELPNIPPFKLAQINYSTMIPGTLKAWHYHHKQDEVWIPIPETGPIIVGLLDIREDSPTLGKTMRIPFGAGIAKYLYIPRGIAHGVSNNTQQVAGLVYLVNNQFDGTDEQRLDAHEGVDENFWHTQAG